MRIIAFFRRNDDSITAVVIAGVIDTIVSLSHIAMEAA
jgi:hypothetical protein